MKRGALELPFFLSLIVLLNAVARLRASMKLGGLYPHIGAHDGTDRGWIMMGRDRPEGQAASAKLKPGKR